MSTLLRIDASARFEASVSREVAEAFETRWRADHPNGLVIRRDLAKTPVEHIREETIRGFYTPEEQFTAELEAATALSDELIAELTEADTLLVSTPIYNFTVPSSLKAWIDQVTRIGVTFGFDPERGLYGLVEGKRAVVVAALGLPYQDTPLQQKDHLRTYLTMWLNFLGISEVEVIAVEGTSVGEDVLVQNKDAALQLIRGEAVGS